MRSGLNGFNMIARRYDTLKQLVFGKSIYLSEICFLDRIPYGGTVLIIGGGSGEILPLLTESDPDAEIWFVEASSVMLRLAAKRLSHISAKRVRFIHGTEQDLPDGLLFDAVITNFFLDLFTDEKARDLCILMTNRLSRGGVWLVSDFVNGKKIWQRSLLWIMYRFFRGTCRVEAVKLPAWSHHIQVAGMEELSSCSFFRGFIHSALYRRKSSSLRQR